MAGVDDRSETAATTLLVRHLPEAIPESTLSRLFSHYGASSVRSFSSNHNTKLRNCAFLDFHDQPMALQAQRHLNGLRFLGKVLKVERATNPQQPAKTTKTQQDESHKNQPGGTQQPRSSFGDNEVVFAAEPIASRLGVDYPYPPHLEYAYPPPDGNILTNIVNALIAVPRFYTQVLHLMNKMNIPAPFRSALPTPPLPPPPPPPPPGESTKQPLAELSSEESEMESSDEEANTSGRSKRVKRDTIVGPAIDKDVSHEAVGVKAATLLPREIPVIKKRNPVLQIKIAPKSSRKEHVDDDDNFVRDKEESKTGSIDIDIQPYATPEEIQNGKLGAEELLSLPVFKNYKVGTPASVLYIKNLAKDVVSDDFYYIFGSLFGSIDLAKSSVSVKLMQEGRMRGQAFVTFPSVELAHRALNLVNGFDFKGKPMVIQFGRNVAASKEKE